MKKMLPLFLACALCLSTLCVGASASAKSTLKIKGTNTDISGDGYHYLAWCTLYVSDGFAASVEVKKNGTILDPPNALTYRAVLCSGDGTVRAVNSAEAGTHMDTFPPVMTNYWQGSSAYAKGIVRLRTTYAGTKEINLKPTSVYTAGRTASDSDSVMENLIATLDEDGQYPVNANGESYGSTLLFDIVGEEPDLIQAEGMDGTEGYVRKTELYADYNLGSEDILIPLYDINGTEIGSLMVYDADASASNAG